MAVHLRDVEARWAANVHKEGVRPLNQTAAFVCRALRAEARVSEVRVEKAHGRLRVSVSVTFNQS